MSETEIEWLLRRWREQEERVRRLRIRAETDRNAIYEIAKEQPKLFTARIDYYMALERQREAQKAPKGWDEVTS